MSDNLTQPLNKSIKDSVDPTSIVAASPHQAPANQNVFTESMLSVDSEKIEKLMKRYKILTGAGICCLIIGLIFFLLLPPIIHSQIISQATEQSILSEDNEGLWAHFPGQSGTIITRNYSFFNMINEEDVLLHNAKPKFRQIEGYIITEMEDYLDIKYIDEGRKVTMKDWLHFDIHQDSRNMQEKIKIINLPSLGYWYSLKNSRESQVFIQGLSLLFTNIEESLIQTVIGQGIYSQYFSDYQTTINNFFKPANISKEMNYFLYHDYTYGFGEQDNLKYWVEAAGNSFTPQSPGFSKDAINLKDYFTLNDQQLFSLLTQFKDYVTSIDDLIIKNNYCKNIENCTGRQLAIRQMASSYVTKNVPPVGEIEPTDSICEANVTCEGFYVELSAYYEKVYRIQHPQESPLVTFDVDMVRGWLDYNPNNIEGQYSKAQNALFHIGNLDALFANGTLYDETKDDKLKNTYLANIRNRFKLSDNAVTKVFWGWVKYIQNRVLRQQTKGNQKLGIAQGFTGAFYESFSILQDQLQPFALKQVMKNSLNHTKCSQLLSISLQTDNEQLVSKICDEFNNTIKSDEFLEFGINVCRKKFQEDWQKLIDIGANAVQVESFCDETIENGFGQLYHRSRISINDFYGCHKTPNQYCSDYELALKQWTNSEITNTENPNFADNIKLSTTFADWYPKAKAFEYRHYAKKFPQRSFKNITVDDVFDKINFDHYFSATKMLEMYNNNQTSQQFKDYMRYVVIFIGFNGFTRERTAKQFIFGYNDEYLLSLKNTYPPFGGDPSIPAYTAFNDLNLTEENTTLELQWHTGKDNISMLAQYSKINGLPYLTNNMTKFNGNETYWVLQSPWQGQDYFYGTSGKQFPPNQEQTKNISIYVPNIQRYGSGSSIQSYPYERYGYQLRIIYLGESIFESMSTSEENKKYYQTFYAIFNETSVLGLPLFLTKHHFMNCTSNWTDIIEMYNENMDIKYENTSHWDDSYVIYEPNSGLAFQSTIFLQGNYYYEPDQLFQYNQTTLMPVFSLYRSGNVTQDEANELFSDLKTAITLKTVIFYIGLVIAILSLIGTIFIWTRKRSLQKQMNRKTKNLDLSMQENQNRQTHKKQGQREMIVEKNDQELQNEQGVLYQQPKESQMKFPEQLKESEEEEQPKESEEERQLKESEEEEQLRESEEERQLKESEEEEQLKESEEERQPKESEEEEQLSGEIKEE